MIEPHGFPVCRGRRKRFWRPRDSGPASRAGQTAIVAYLQVPAVRVHYMEAFECTFMGRHGTQATLLEHSSDAFAFQLPMTKANPVTTTSRPSGTFTEKLPEATWRKTADSQAPMSRIACCPSSLRHFQPNRAT